MAYKFQLGAAVLSGSLTQKGDVLAEASVLSGSSLSLAGTAITATAAELNILDGVTAEASELNLVDGAAAGSVVNSKAVIYGAAGQVVATSVSASGGVSGSVVVATSVLNGPSLTDDGSAPEFSAEVNLNAGFQISGTTVTAGAADLNLLTNITSAAYVAASDLIVFSDADDSGNLKFESGADFVSAIAGAGLASASGVLSVDIDGLTELAVAPHATEDEFMVSDNGTEKRVSMTNVANGAFALVSGDATIAAGGALTIAAGAVENSMLANDDLTIGSTIIDLGGSSTTLAGMTGIDFTAADASIAASLGANTLTLGGATSTVRIAGDLDVVGTLNRVTETELLIEDKAIIVASGSANAAAAAGAGLIVDIATGDKSFLYQANGENVGGVDASASGDIFVASGSAGLIDIQAAAFYGDGSNLTGVAATDARYSINLYPNSGSAYDMNGQPGLWVLNSGTGQAAVATEIHLSGTYANGDAVVVKAPANAATYNLTVKSVGSDTFETGGDTLTFESDSAALTLVYASALNLWTIF